MHDPAARCAITPSYPLTPPPDRVLTGHFRESPGYAVYRPHGLRNWLLTLTIAGHGRYRWGAGEVVTSHGDLVLVAPGVVQDYAVHAAAAPGAVWEFWWVHFQPRPAWFTWWRLPELHPGLHRVALGGTPLRRAVAAFERLHADARLAPLPPDSGPQDQADSGDELRQELALGGVEEILLLAAAEVRRRQHLPLDARIRDVLDLIAADPAHPHRVATLAKAVALSPSRLAHLFRQQVGDSIMNVVLTLRLRRAAQLLEITDRPIATVATQVGFASPYYFSRQFRQRFGVSPTAYRASLVRPAAPDSTSG